MNRYLLTLVFLILTSKIATAQTGQKMYFNGYQQTDSANANYYRVITSGNIDLFTYTDYYTDGTYIMGTGTHSFTSPTRIKDEKHYYKTGVLAILYKYSSTSALVSVTGFYPNGVMMYNEVPRGPFRLVNYDADSSGHAHIIDGNGRRQETDSVSVNTEKVKRHFVMEGAYKDGMKDGQWKGTFENGDTFEEEYKEGKLITGVAKTADGKKHHYTFKLQYPDFGGKLDVFERNIILSLKNSNDTAGLLFLKPGYLRLTYKVNDRGKIVDLKGMRKSDHAPVDIILKEPLPTIDPEKIRGVPVMFVVTDNRDPFIRANFKIVPFQTDLYIRGTYKNKQ